MTDPNDQTSDDLSGANVPLNVVLNVASCDVAENPDGSMTISCGAGTGAINLGFSPVVFSITAAQIAAAQAGGDNSCAILILTQYNNQFSL